MSNGGGFDSGGANLGGADLGGAGTYTDSPTPDDHANAVDHSYELSHVEVQRYQSFHAI